MYILLNQTQGYINNINHKLYTIIYLLIHFVLKTTYELYDSLIEHYRTCYT